MRSGLFLLCFVFLIGILAGCDREGSTNLSEDQIIERDAMVQLLADIEITETALKTRQLKLKRDSFKVITKMAYDSLYIYYNTTPELFKENLKYYQRDMDNYLKMIDEKITLLSRKKDSISLAPVLIDTSSVVLPDTTGKARIDTVKLSVRSAIVRNSAK